MTTPDLETVLRDVAAERMHQADALKVLNIEHRGILFQMMHERDLVAPLFIPEIEERRTDLVELEYIKAHFSDRANYTAIFQKAIDQLTAQIASYKPEDGEGHFLNGEGQTVALLAFYEAADIQLREQIAADVVKNFETGEITMPQTLADIAAELAAGEAVEVQGHAVRIEQGRLALYKGGNVYTLPIPEEPTA